MIDHNIYGDGMKAVIMNRREAIITGLKLFGVGITGATVGTFFGCDSKGKRLNEEGKQILNMEETTPQARRVVDMVNNLDLRRGDFVIVDIKPDLSKMAYQVEKFSGGKPDPTKIIGLYDEVSDTGELEIFGVRNDFRSPAQTLDAPEVVGIKRINTGDKIRVTTRTGEVREGAFTDIQGSAPKNKFAYSPLDLTIFITPRGQNYTVEIELGDVKEISFAK